MSEELLKALTQLFAIITKQDGGVTEKERDFVIHLFQQDLDQNSVREHLELYDNYSEYQKYKSEPAEKTKKLKLTSVRDSVKTLAICKQINKTLSQKQKLVVLVKILELVASDKKFTPQRMEIIDTIATVFNIEKKEYTLIESYILKEKSQEMPYQEILVVSSNGQEKEHGHVQADINGEAIFMRLESEDMYFVKYMGNEELVLNGFIMKKQHVYLFSPGSTIKTPHGEALHYSELIRNYLHELQAVNISFNAQNLEYQFDNGNVGIRNVNLSEGPGKLIGILGASGAGKTTVLNVLAGILKPTKGKIKVNGFDINREKEQIQGVIGYISQDDLLMEDLTVYQNMYYNAKLCFAHLSQEALDQRVMEVLQSLGLDQSKDLRVGSVLDKTISGGQRKRLNIALELIREPAVLFVDEPTSGLSSRDSENVIDLLKELSLKGKLIFTVIHQPSSDIYKMFDKVYFLDVGGYPIFYGNPVEAVTYFKKETNQVDSERGQCPSCGNVNSEQILNIIEANVVDEYGQFTNKRKINPEQWYERFSQYFKLDHLEDVKEPPSQTLVLASKFNQLLVFITRDFLSKISNKQYLLINFLEAPLLALILAFIVRYKSSPDHSEYIFRFNENIPVYIMISIIIALFMGLTVSAEEIIRDRKIRKRESFLNLSWNSYLMSKVVLLFTLSAIQTLTFVVVGNLILEIKEMTLSYWLVLFSVSCMANMLGLNISSPFNSAVTVYILIPLIIIPQMVLSGLLFSFDKINEVISSKDKVPLVADFMASRWAYEAISVNQFINNSYQSYFYPFEKEERQSDFNTAYLIPRLKDKLKYATKNLNNPDVVVVKKVREDLKIISRGIRKLAIQDGLVNIDLRNDITAEKMSPELEEQLFAYLNKADYYYKDKFNRAVVGKEKVIQILESSEDFDYDLNAYKNLYFNESLSDLVRNINVKDRIIEFRGNLIQRIDPIFHDPTPNGPLNYRTHFFAPIKHFLFKTWDTYTFNVLVIWFMTLLLYITLYYDLLRKFLQLLEKARWRN